MSSFGGLDGTGLTTRHQLPPHAGGDVKGGAKVEPYAYWPLDRRLMNRRQQKAKGAKQGLDKIVAAAKAGAAKGHKAKRQRR